MIQREYPKNTPEALPMKTLRFFTPLVFLLLVTATGHAQTTETLTPEVKTAISSLPRFQLLCAIDVPGFEKAVGHSPTDVGGETHDVSPSRTIQKTLRQCREDWPFSESNGFKPVFLKEFGVETVSLERFVIAGDPGEGDILDRGICF
jgi:hypothetical protein